ncbi:MAG: tetratricopeptide repeat protein [Chthoniobacterales bacterium]
MIADLEMAKQTKGEALHSQELPSSERRSVKTRWVFSPEVYVFLGVFALRLFVLVRLTESPFLLPEAGDSQFYNDWALRILRGQWTDHAAFYGLPLYAYLLAGIYKIVGYNPFVPGLLQAALEGGTAVLLYQLGQALYGGEANSPRGQIVGLIAAVTWGGFQAAAAFSVILMPTSWLVFVFWYCVWLIVKRRSVPSRWGLLAMGALMGFTAMGIATILFLVPLAIAAIFLRWPDRLPRQSVGTLVLLAGVLLGTSPAWMHNYFVAQDPVFLSAHGGVNLWIGNNPIATGYPRFPPGLHASQQAMLKDSITGAEQAAGHRLKRSEVSSYWSGKARAWITHHPLKWIRLLGTKVTKFWNAFQYDDLSIISALRDEGVLFPGLRFGLVAALAIPGFFLTCRRFPLSNWVAAAVLLHLLSLLPVFVTERYRLAAVPGLLLFAAIGIWELWNNLVTGGYHRIALYVGLLVASTWFVSLPQREPSLWALDSYNSGLRALQTNNLASADRKLNFAYAYSPQNAELNFALGNLRLAQGNVSAAKRFYLATLRLDPRHEGSYNNLGVIALNEKRWDLAVNFFTQALELEPHDSKTLYLLAQTHFQAGDLATARIRVEQAIKLIPNQPDFLSLHGEIEEKMNSTPSPRIKRSLHPTR